MVDFRRLSGHPRRDEQHEEREHLTEHVNASSLSLSLLCTIERMDNQTNRRLVVSYAARLWQSHVLSSSSSSSSTSSCCFQGRTRARNYACFFSTTLAGEKKYITTNALLLSRTTHRLHVYTHISRENASSNLRSCSARVRKRGSDGKDESSVSFTCSTIAKKVTNERLDEVTSARNSRSLGYPKRLIQSGNNKSLLLHFLVTGKCQRSSISFASTVEMVAIQDCATNGCAHAIKVSSHPPLPPLFLMKCVNETNDRVYA